MLRMQTVHIVRHQVLVEGISVQPVARDLGLRHTTIDTYLAGPTPERVEATPRRRPVLDAVSSRLCAPGSVALPDHCHTTAARGPTPPATAARRLYDQRPRGASVRAPEATAGGGSHCPAELASERTRGSRRFCCGRRRARAAAARREVPQAPHGLQL
jgi:hypothetical protein